MTETTQDPPSAKDRHRFAWLPEGFRIWRFSMLGRKIVLAMALVAIAVTAVSAVTFHFMGAPDGADLSTTVNFAAITLLQTLSLGFFMLLIFDRLAARAIRQSVCHLRKAHWRSPDSLVQMSRQEGVFPREFRGIVDTLESMRQQARDAYSELETQSAEMARLNKSVSQAYREQADLTNALSHGLLSPVNSLDMLLQEVISERAAMPVDIAEDLTDMHATLERLRGQISAVGHYAEILDRPPRIETVDLDEICNQVVCRFSESIDKRSAKVVIHPLGTADGDREHIEDFCREILKNSLAYGDDTRALRIDLRTVPGPAPNSVDLRIEDTGRGIDPRFQDRVQGLFYRLHAYGDIPGYGLGLPMCRQIARRLGTDLHLESEPGVGTRVSLTLNRSEP